MKKLIQFTLIMSFLAAFASFAWAADGHSVKGVVKAVKADDRKLNISHGPIPSLGMSAMTMDFKVMDPAMLDEVKKGHEVAFVIEKDKAGNFVITEIEDMGMAKGMSMNDASMKGDHKHMH